MKAGLLKESVLKVVLAPPDDPEGSPVIRYRPPPVGANLDRQVILHEAQWPDDGCTCLYTNDIYYTIAVFNQKDFEERIK